MSDPVLNMATWTETAEAFAARFIGAGTAGEASRGHALRLATCVAGATLLAILTLAISGPGLFEINLVIGASLVAAAAGILFMAAIVVTPASAVTAIAALLAGGALVAVLVAMTGGFAGPLAAFLFAPALEAWWVRRSRSALLAGLAVSAAAVAMQFALAPPVAGGTSALASLVVVLWVASLGLRLAGESVARAGTHARHDEAEALTSLQEVAILTLKDNGDLDAVTHHVRTMLGIHPGLLLGSGLFDRIHIADRIAYLTAIADMRDGAPRCKVSIRLRQPATGETAQTLFRAFSIELVRDRTGLLRGFMQADDVAAGLREELAAICDEAALVDIAKNRFLASVSHELRTPLNAIIGFADILHQEMFGGFEDPRQKEYAGLISSSGKHLLSVVNSILDVSKIESGTYSISSHDFDFAEAAAMPVSMVARQADEKQITLNQMIDPSCGEVHGDRRAIQQILINLLSNAVKFTPQGGSVTLGARSHGGRFTFWINDSGIGIHADDLKRLGQPFMQVQNDYTRHFEGTGLGLSLVKGLVKLHGGTMAIDSAPGEGTCVTITLPEAAAAAPEGPVVQLTGKTKGESDASIRKIA